MLNFVYITTKDKAEARKIGRVLVESRLAACVNIIDKMEIKSEYTCILSVVAW